VNRSGCLDDSPIARRDQRRLQRLDVIRKGFTTRIHAEKLVRSLSPANIDFGKVPKTPIDQTVEILQSVLRNGKHT
jgi:hypothetical protein